MEDTTNKILAIVAHPDDELLGLGGTLVKHVKQGDTVSILILGDGEESRDVGVNVPKRADMARKVGEKLGAQEVILESFKDNEFDSHSLLSITKVVERHIAAIKPTTVYTHHPQDLNVDHRMTTQAVITAARPMEGYSVKKILAFETVSATEWQIARSEFAFLPTEYVNITDELEQKIEFLKIYDDEMRIYPHPRSYEGIRILAQHRGMEVGYKAAEAFEVIRNLRD